MFKGMGGMLEQAKKMQEELKKVQQEAEKKTVEATAGGGMVKVVVNGKQEVLSITIEESVLKMNDKQMIEDLVKAGVNEALKSSQKLMQDALGDLTSGLGPLGSLLK